MQAHTITRHPAERGQYATVTFTDAFGDATTGLFLGVEPGGTQAVRILVGGRIEKRATRDRAGNDRAFDLAVA